MTTTMALGRSLASLAVLSLAAMASGCAMTAPRYTASLNNVQVLKDGAIQPAKVGTFRADPEKDNAKTISLRGSSLASPYNNSYPEYLA